jgi:ATP-dependent RNA circularization protein (DNA/RNA ligase family)
MAIPGQVNGRLRSRRAGANYGNFFSACRFFGNIPKLFFISVICRIAFQSRD